MVRWNGREEKPTKLKLSGIQALFQIGGGDTNLRQVPVAGVRVLVLGPFQRVPMAAEPHRSRCVPTTLRGAGALSSHGPGDGALMPGDVGCCLSTFRYLQRIDMNVTIYACWEQLEG